MLRRDDIQGEEKLMESEGYEKDDGWGMVGK